MEIWGSYFTVNEASAQNTFFGDTLCKEEWDARHRGLSDHSHQSQLRCTERDVHQGNKRGLLCGCFTPTKSCVTRRRFVWHLFSAAVKNTQQGLLQALQMFSQDPEETCSERCFSGTQGHLQGLESNLRGNKLLRVRIFNNKERMAYPQRSVGRTRMKKNLRGYCAGIWAKKYLTLTYSGQWKIAISKFRWEAFSPAAVTCSSPPSHYHKYTHQRAIPGSPTRRLSWDTELCSGEYFVVFWTIFSNSGACQPFSC